MSGPLPAPTVAAPAFADPALWCALLGVTAAAAGLAGVVRWAAPRLGVTDAPDGGRKRHRKVTPLWGGLAVVGAFLLGAAALAALGLGLPSGPGLWGLGLSAAGFCLVGAWDDARPVRARTKLAGMFAAAVPFAALGPAVTHLDLFGWHTEFPAWAGAAFAVVWLVGWANVVNLSDGLDGLASGVGLIVASALAAHATLRGAPGVAAVAAAFAAALLGFLPHNLPTRRAKLFLGDSGSLPIGAVLGMLSLWAATKTFSGVTAAGALTGALAAGAVSGFDVFAAMARRRLSGKSIAAADRHHLHHRLQDRGLSVARTLAAILAMTSLTAAAGLAGAYLETPWVAPAVCLGLFAALAGARVFGHHEAALLRSWLGTKAVRTWDRRPVRLRVVRPPGGEVRAEVPDVSAPPAERRRAA